MNRNAILLAASTFALLNCHFLAAQDYTLSSLTGESQYGESQYAGMKVGKLPSDFWGAEEEATIATPAIDVGTAHRRENLAVLAGLGALLALGGSITAGCIMKKRKQTTPALRVHQMVGA